jgi:hypothetical protein
VIDMNTSFNSGTMLQGGGLLPNATGAAFMAAQVFAALDPWLFKPPPLDFPLGPQFTRIEMTPRGPWPEYPLRLDHGFNGEEVITWWTPGDDGDNSFSNSRTFKAGQDLISVVGIGGINGYTQNAAGGVSFSGGNVADTNAGNYIHLAASVGPGMSASMAMRPWPDFGIARFYCYTAAPMQLTITANSDDTDAVEQIIQIGNAAEPWWDEFTVGADFYFDVKFASVQAGKTLTVTIARNGGSMGYLIFNAIQLLKAIPEDNLGGPSVPSF